MSDDEREESQRVRRGGGGLEELTDGCLFSAKVDSVGTVASLLKAVAISEKVNVFINPNGMKFSVEEGKYVQATILMQKELFQEFSVEGDSEIFFKIPLKELLECLKIFFNDGKSSNNDTTLDNLSGTSLNLVYRQDGAPFEILLEENKVLTDFQLKTEEIDDLMEFEINPVSCRVLLKADHFFDLLAEVDSNSPESIEIRVIPHDNLQLKARGTSGLMTVHIPMNSQSVELFECEGNEDCKARYKFSILKYAFKALQLGQKVMLKMNAEGILSLSVVLLSANKTDSFLDFCCMPLQGDDVEDEPIAP